MLAQRMLELEYGGNYEWTTLISINRCSTTLDCHDSVAYLGKFCFQIRIFLGEHLQFELRDTELLGLRGHHVGPHHVVRLEGLLPELDLVLESLNDPVPLGQPVSNVLLSLEDPKPLIAIHFGITGADSYYSSELVLSPKPY